MGYEETSTPLHLIFLDDAEVQMIYSGLVRTKPYAEMSAELAEIERGLEIRFRNILERIKSRESTVSPN